MPDYNGVIWRVNYGEIAERNQFRVGYVGQQSFDGYFELDQLSDLITVLNAVQSASLNQLIKGNTVQARKASDGIVTRVIIEPRMDNFPPQIMALTSTTLSDLIYALQLFQTALSGAPIPDDWDGSYEKPYVWVDQKGILQPPNNAISIAVQAAQTAAQQANDAAAKLTPEMLQDAAAASIPAALALYPEVISAAASRALADQGLARKTDPGMPSALAPDIFTWLDKRKRRLAGIQSDGKLFSSLGVATPRAGLPVPAGSPVLTGTWDPVRRRWYQDAIGPDGRFLQETIDSIAKRINDGGTRKAPHVLNASGGYTLTDGATSRTVRWPIKVPVAVSSASFEIRNRHDGGDGRVYTGQIDCTGLWWGKAARDADGLLTGGFASAPTQIAGPFTMPADASAVSVPLTLPSGIPVGEDYIISMGYTCAAGQINHVGVGGGWWSTDAAQANTTGAIGTLTYLTPFSAWLNCTIPGKTPVLGWLGDSLYTGLAATLPVYDSPARQHAFRHGIWPAMWIASGSSMTHWIYGDDVRWTKFGDVKPDAVVNGMGSNDIFDGADFPTCKSLYVLLHPIIVSKLGTPKIFASTILPRNGSKSDAAREAVRTAYNSYLFQRPMGIRGVFDFAKAVESPTTPGTISAAYVDVDGIHLNTAGYAQKSLVVPGRIA